MTEEGIRREFHIEACLGKGGFGEVYHAQMRSSGGLESEVAVKVLRGDLDPASQAVQRLRDEGRMLARLNHPAILKVHDLVLLEGRIALVTEFVDGQDLAECVRGEGAMPMRPLLECIAAVAGALDAAWSTSGPDGTPLQLVHRDIKPSNIRISKHGQVKVLDFGIARSDTMTREARTQTNLMVGSPHYLAPERFIQPAGGPESDIFALGCALFEGLTGGVRLYGEDTVLMMSGQALDKGRFEGAMNERLARLDDSVDPEVRGLLQQLLQHDPAARPSASDLQSRVENLAEEFQGPSLKRWARARNWPPLGQFDAALNGRTVTEGTLAAPSPSQQTTMTTPATPAMVDSPTHTEDLGAPAPRTGLAIVVAGLSAMLAAGVLVAAGLGGFALFQMSGDDASTSDAAAAEGDELEAEDGAAVAEGEDDAAAEAEVAGEDEAEGPAPNGVEPAVDVEPAATAAPEPDAEPAVAAKPAPAASRPVAKPATGSVAATGGVDVELRAGGSVHAPGAVPVGTYEVWARFGDEMRKQAKPVTVLRGGTHTIACSARMYRCDVR